ncbi:B-cell antigen receptor complex-associated protein alpha chain [Scomber japonicus]|uniref:B-cell antigen receptor complex-associated protein alpha chain n=1 Tax=Scomber japonicus TaxID=13676 RepID=UPI0023063227|nr:B-cell antigen receptor complex-associated protein alpha chain [Scomber japonicus]
MATVTFFLLCSFIVLSAQGEVTVKDDRTWIRVKISDNVVLKCCYEDTDEPSQVKLTWVNVVKAANNTYAKQLVERSHVIKDKKDDKFSKEVCGTLEFTSVRLNDTGLYQCRLDGSRVYHTHGTYLQVYKPIEKTINLSERTKNRILTAEGILLLLCVLVPSATLLQKSKKLYQLEKKKVNKEEENIYQGLNLDDCCNTTYDQIERSQAQGPYQDVGNIMEEAEIQLEKP